MEESKARQYQKWHEDPRNWKWGFFYFNTADKRLFPPKRVKVTGWTINFANPISILVHVFALLMVLMLINWSS